MYSDSAQSTNSPRGVPRLGKFSRYSLIYLHAKKKREKKRDAGSVDVSSNLPAADRLYLRPLSTETDVHLFNLSTLAGR